MDIKLTEKMTEIMAEGFLNALRDNLRFSFDTDCHGRPVIEARLKDTEEVVSWSLLRDINVPVEEVESVVDGIKGVLKTLEDAT